MDTVSRPDRPVSAQKIHAGDRDFMKLRRNRRKCPPDPGRLHLKSEVGEISGVKIEWDTLIRDLDRLGRR